MKRFLIGILVLAMVLTLCACARRNDVGEATPPATTNSNEIPTPTTEPPSTTAPPATTVPPTTAEPVNEDVELIFWRAEHHGEFEGYPENAIFVGWIVAVNMLTDVAPNDGLPISVYTESGAYLQLEISATKGYLYGGEYDIAPDGTSTKREFKGQYGKSASITSERTIYWRFWGKNAETGETEEVGYSEEENKDIFVEIIVRQDGYIVGYAVIEILFGYPEQEYPNFVYSSFLLTSEYFPPKDGVYQDITEDYVRQQIELAKQG